MPYKKRDLPIGKQFNKLKIIKEVLCNEKCRRYVYCLCDCGSKKVMRYDSFIKDNNLLNCFYEKYPNLDLTTLADLVRIS